MSEYASATIVLRRHDGSSVEIDIPHGNYVDAKVDVDPRVSLVDFGEPPRYISGRPLIEIYVRAEHAPGGPSVLANRTNRAAEEPTR